MDVVRQFSDEMNTVLEGKLPVSRAKMASITRIALKAAKFYKHIVMTVEKFLSKCPSEYKVPGLYVIDSIVRQSRHQFGIEKDNYGPRFSRSFEKTFLHLFVCPSEDKPKIIRVLNLWQKNGVFSPEVIQPLLALAPSPEDSPRSPQEPPPTKKSAPIEDGGLNLNSATAIIQHQQSQIQALLEQQHQLQNQASTLLGPALQGLLAQAKDNVDITSLLKQTQDLTATQDLLAAQDAQKLPGSSRTNGDPPPAQMSNSRPIISNREQHEEFNTALLDDFDYSDDDDDEPSKRKRTTETKVEHQQEPKRDSTDHILEELQEQFIRQESARVEKPPPHQLPPPLPQHYPPPSRPHPPPIPPHPYPPPDMPLPPRMGAPIRPPLPPFEYNHRGPPPPSHPPHYPPLPPHHPHHSPPSPYNRRGYRSPPGASMRARRPRSPSPIRRHSGSWRDRDRDRDRDRRSPWRRSRSPSFRDRNDSRSKSSPHRSPRRRSEDNDRSRKGSLSHKEKHLTVLTTTIWMGHLAKSVIKEQIAEACSGHGRVHSVDVVSARGCAYIVMDSRPDAMKVLNGLKDVKLNGSVCKLAWAPGRGVKGGAYRNFWNLDDGVSVIPWEAISSPSELAKFTDGGWIEPGTCPPGMSPPEPTKVDVSQPPPLFPPAGGPAPPLFPPQGMHPLHPGAPPPSMYQLPPPVSGGPPFPLVPPNNLPPHLPSNNNTVDMQIVSSPPHEL